jgi:hypothetical protein
VGIGVEDGVRMDEGVEAGEGPACRQPHRPESSRRKISCDVSITSFSLKDSILDEL